MQVFQNDKKTLDVTSIKNKPIVKKFNSLENSLKGLGGFSSHLLKKDSPYNKLFPNSKRMIIEMQTTLDGQNYLLQVTPIHDKVPSKNIKKSLKDFESVPSSSVPIYLHLGNLPLEDSIIEVLTLPYLPTHRVGKIGSYHGEVENTAFFGSHAYDDPAETEFHCIHSDGSFIDAKTNGRGNPDLRTIFCNSIEGSNHPIISSFCKPRFSVITDWYSLFSENEKIEMMENLTGSRNQSDSANERFPAKEIHTYVHIIKKDDQLYVERLLPKD